MKKPSEMRRLSRGGCRFVLFLVAQVLIVALIVVKTRSSRQICDTNPGWFSGDLESSFKSPRALTGGLDTEAARQLKFIRHELSWMSQVYHDEITPALKPPQDIFNRSIPLQDFCEGKRDNGTNPQYAVFRNVMLVARQLLLPSSINCSTIPRDIASLRTPYHKGQNSTPELQARVVPDTDSFEDFESEYSCHERVYEPSVLFSFINWPQHGHALFNAVSLLWEAFQHSETGPLSQAGKDVKLYAYGDDLNKEGRLEWQQYLPFFDVRVLQPFMSMFSHQPVRSLGSLLMQSERHPICFSYLLAGISGELHHYNFNVSLGMWRDFAWAVRDHFGVPHTPRLSHGPPLERLVPSGDKWLPNIDVADLGDIVPVDWGKLQERPRLVILDRRDNRVIINVKELLEIAKSSSQFKSVEVVYLEDLGLETQIRLIGETGVLFGMDGTGLMSGIFMPEGGIVVHVRPYGCAEFLPEKGTNFDRLWSAHPGRVIRYESGDRNSTVFPRNIVERPELVINHNSTSAYRFPFILRQDTVIDSVAFRCILDASDKLLHGASVDWKLHNLCTKSVFV